MPAMVNVVQIIISNIAHSVYMRFTLFLKFCEIAVCFAQFGLFEISTPVMSNMLTMANIVWMIITNIAHTVYIWF